MESSICTGGTSVLNIEKCVADHMSFDVWNTLISPNLDFSRARNQTIAEAFDVPLEEAKRTFTQTKRFLDSAAEVSGFGASTPECWAILNAAFGSKAIASDRLEALRARVTQLFEEMPPTLPTEVVHALRELKGAGYTMNILSNTNFISGVVLMDVVFNPALGEQFFDFALFSDLHGVAKPSFKFFDMAQEHIDRIDRYRPFMLEPEVQVVHIGDNEITDVEGAIRIGWSHILVSSPINTANQIMERIINA